MKLKEINIAGFALGILILLQGCSSNLEVISKWAEQSITIDGKYDDWDNKTIYIEDGNFLMGIQNDDEYLYLAFISADRNIQAQIMRSGLIVWFDREGGADKKFGVKFPIGFMEDEIIPMRQSIEENPDLFDQIFKRGRMNWKY